MSTISMRLIPEQLNALQRQQLERQIRYHQEAPPLEDVALCDQLTLTLSIASEVTRPMSSKYLAKWLWDEQHSYRGKRVLDIGTGSGVQGITCALGGAAHVTCTDVYATSVACADANFPRALDPDMRQVMTSDLFTEIPREERFDLIIFAQPYFASDPVPEFPFTRGMLDSGSLVRRFLADAPCYLSEAGRVVMLRWEFAGPVNDPVAHGPGSGYSINRRVPFSSGDDLQSGDFEVVVLQPS